MIVVSYGGGTDSTALLVEACNRGIRPDLIFFADTGSEMPHTYAYLPIVGEWLARVGFPEIQVVRWSRQSGEIRPLHVDCEQKNQLPSAAYGMAGCTSKWKQFPLDKTINNHPGVIAALARGETVERWLGYDATEGARVANIAHKPPPYKWRAPLYDWDIARAECREIIKAAGLPQPGKSACFICPNMRGHEVDKLAAEYPELMAKALTIEDNAVRLTIETPDLAQQGLGRNIHPKMRWSEWLKRPKQMDIFNREEDDGEAMPCGCHDRRVVRAVVMGRQKPYKPQQSWLTPWYDQLGKRPHAEIAREAGVSPSTVYQMAARKAEKELRSLLR